MKGPLASDYFTDLWTLKNVAEVIRQEYGVEYNVTHVCGVLWDNYRPHCRKDLKQFLHDRRERLYTRRFSSPSP